MIKLHPKVLEYLRRIREAADLEQRLLQGNEWRIKWLEKRRKKHEKKD